LEGIIVGNVEGISVGPVGNKVGATLGPKVEIIEGLDVTVGTGVGS